jgi:hypothetical protein
MTAESEVDLALEDQPIQGRARPAGPWDSPPAAPLTIGDPGRAFTEVRPALRTDATQPPDTVVDHGRVGGLEVRAASVRGLSHRQAGVPRQDAYGFAAPTGADLLIAVVADGVSAGVLSHEAASFVGRRGPREVVRHLSGGTPPEDLPWHDVFGSLAATIYAEGARSLGRTDPERYAVDAPAEAEIAAAMATTATFVVCETGSRDDGRRVWVAWMGDSPAWEVTAAGSWRHLSAVKNAGREVNSSSVAALPQMPRDPRDLPVRSTCVDDRSVIVLMTDGTGDPLGDGTGEVATRLAAWWRRPPPPLTFADQVGFGRRSYDDDRTVVALWPYGGKERG